MHRPDVLQRLHPRAAVRGWSGRVRPSATGHADRLDRAVGQDQRPVQCGGAPLRPRPARALGQLRNGPAQGRRDARAPGRVHRIAGVGVHRPGPGEDRRVPHRETPQQPGAVLPVDREVHRYGQPLLLLCRGRGLRPVLHQVLLVLPLQRQAVYQRQPLGPAPGDQGPDRVHPAGQRVRPRRGPGRAATDLRPAWTRSDQRPVGQVAGDLAGPVHRRRPRRRVPLRDIGPAGASSR